MRRLVGMVTLFGLVAAGVPALVPATAWAADKKDKKEDPKDEDDLDLGDTTPSPDDFSDEEDEPPPSSKPDADEPKKDDDDFDLDEEDDTDIDFKDDTSQETVKPRGPGEDTAALYREAQSKYSSMNADEEILRWEQYLQKYPNSLFKDRIEARMDELSAELYGERVPGSDRGVDTTVDAAKRELNFAQPVRFASVDPRTHLTAGFEFGIPNLLGGKLDFEYQIQRSWSAHIGLRRDLTESQAVLGTRYALLKSSRTKSIFSGGLDVNLNYPNVFLSLQPTLGFGQRLDVADGLDLQVMVGAVAELSKPAAMRYTAGLSGELRANETVAIFGETTLNTKYLASPEVNPFSFDIATFGLKFFPMKGKGDNLDGRLFVDLSASIPYSWHYWGFYQAAVKSNLAYYF